MLMKFTIKRDVNIATKLVENNMNYLKVISHKLMYIYVYALYFHIIYYIIFASNDIIK